MNKKQMVTNFVVGLILVSLVVLAACQPNGATQKSVASSKDVSSALVSLPISDAQRARSEAASIARWEAMADFYLSPSPRALAADQARWEAMAKFYAGSPERAIAADQARWEAMALYYAELAEVVRARSLAADQARWEAQAEYYANQGQLVVNHRSNLALAAHYTGLALLHYELTGDSKALPDSVSPELTAVLADSGAHVQTAMDFVSPQETN